MACVVWDYSNSKQIDKKYKLSTSCKTQIKILANAGLALSGFEQPGPEGYN